MGLSDHANPTPLTLPVFHLSSQQSALLTLRSITWEQVGDRSGSFPWRRGESRQINFLRGDVGGAWSEKNPIHWMERRRVLAIGSVTLYAAYTTNPINFILGHISQLGSQPVGGQINLLFDWTPYFVCNRK